VGQSELGKYELNKHPTTGQVKNQQGQTTKLQKQHCRPSTG